MPNDKKNLLRRFANDQPMERAVHSFLVNFFLKPPKNRDVQSLAAAWLSKDTFNDAWRELMNVKNPDAEKKELKQVGL